MKTAIDHAKAAVRAKKKTKNVGARALSVSAGKKKKTPVAIASINRPKATRTLASLRVFRHPFPIKKAHSDSVACCFSGLTGQAAIGLLHENA
jgi:hypothetical protein